MIKLYYTDPLAAAYMAHTFGVKIGINQYNNMNKLRMQSVDSILNHGVRANFYTYYIHPDSIDIFKPMVGDLVRFREKHAAYVYADNLMSIPDSSPYNGDPCYEFTGGKEIIQRNGKSFFNPEVSDE